MCVVADLGVSGLCYLVLRYMESFTGYFVHCVSKDIGICGGSLVVLVSLLIGCVQVRVCRDVVVQELVAHGGS